MRLLPMRSCAYCGATFQPKRSDSKCCTRWHSQAHSRVGRPRVDVAPRPDVSVLPACCRDHVAAGKPGDHRRAVCPQHQTARKVRNEELVWLCDYRNFQRTHDEAWQTAGFTILGSLGSAA